MSRKNVAIALLSLLTTALGAVLSGCGNERPVANASPETIGDVSVIVAQETAVPDWLETVGTVEAAQTSQISSQMTGNIIEIEAHEGDRVKRGQVLAVIDEAQPREAVDQATAALAAAGKEVSAADSEFVLAESTLKRYQQLYGKKSVSPQEFDEINAKSQSAQARRDMAGARQAQASAALAEARTSLGYARIRSPFAGLVTQKMADAGTMASPGMPVFTVEDTRSYRLEVPVDESDIHLVHLGETAPASIDALGNAQLTGRIVQIVPAADPASHSFLVKISLPRDTRLRSGLFGRADFARGQRHTLLIPRASIVRRGQLDGVYVLDANQIAELRYVTLGMSAGESVEVLSGLQNGDELVAAPGDRELGGKRIVERP